MPSHKPLLAWQPNNKVRCRDSIGVSMSLRNTFRSEVKKQARQALVAHGFTGTESTFKRTVSNNLLIVNFQRSANNSDSALSFTVNLGILSCRLSSFFGPGECSTVRGLDVWHCHYQIRVGQLGPEPFDKWWSTADEDTIPPLVSDATGMLVTYGLPNLYSLASDEALRDLWLSGNAPSLTNMARLTYLHYLLSTIGPSHLISDIENELRAATGNAKIMVDVYFETLKKQKA